jgi:hypothetical protein
MIATSIVIYHRTGLNFIIIYGENNFLANVAQDKKMATTAVTKALTSGRVDAKPFREKGQCTSRILNLNRSTLQ